MKILTEFRFATCFSPARALPYYRNKSLTSQIGKGVYLLNIRYFENGEILTDTKSNELLTNKYFST